MISYDLDFKKEGGSGADMKRSVLQLFEYKSCLSKNPLVSMEDPFDQGDWDAYKQFMVEVGKDWEQQIFGDDLVVTNPTLTPGAATGEPKGG